MQECYTYIFTGLYDASCIKYCTVSKWEYHLQLQYDLCTYTKLLDIWHMFLYFTYNNLVYCNKINVTFSTPTAIRALSFILHYAVSPTDKYTQKLSMDANIATTYSIKYNFPAWQKQWKFSNSKLPLHNVHMRLFCTYIKLIHYVYVPNILCSSSFLSSPIWLCSWYFLVD